MAIDERLLAKFETALADRERARSVPNDPSKTGGGPPDEPGAGLLALRVEGLDKRLDKLDGRLEKIDDRLRGVETAIAEVNGKMDTLTGSVVGKLPSWWQIPAAIVSVFALLAAALKWLHLPP